MGVEKKHLIVPMSEQDMRVRNIAEIFGRNNFTVSRNPGAYSLKFWQQKAVLDLERPSKMSDPRQDIPSKIYRGGGRQTLEHT